MLHSAETIDLTFADGLVSSTIRIAVPGGWIYSGATAVFVPDPRAPHVRDARRLKLREGWSVTGDEFNLAGISYDRAGQLWTAIHADGSETDHATRLEAHDALIASGSESPFEVVTGPAVKE
jgi:hypothetical protein